RARAEERAVEPVPTVEGSRVGKERRLGEWAGRVGRLLHDDMDVRVHDAVSEEPSQRSAQALEQVQAVTIVEDQPRVGVLAREDVRCVHALSGNAGPRRAAGPFTGSQGRI